MSAAREGAGAARLSALVVNYNSGAYARACVESLLAEWRRCGRAGGDLEIVVVDNCSPREQGPWLAAIEALGARVLRNPVNAGYAAGINLALAHTRGEPRDVVAILNPDLFFLPGSVDALMSWVREHPECGAVDPRTWVDQARQLNLPRNTLPTPLEHWRQVLALMSPALCRAYSRRRLRRVLPWWTGARPIEADMLSGCCVFMRREVVQRLPALLDEAYPLYFEDTDLFSTLRRMGYRVVHHTGAPVLHHWSRSAGVGATFEGETLRRFQVGEEHYYRKFHGRAGWAAVRMAYALLERWPKRLSHRPMHSLVDLGGVAEPLALELPRACDFLLEFSLSPTWPLAAGVIGSGARWTCPAETWEWYFQTRYFVRALDRATGDLLGAWTFHKTTPGRDTPLAHEELNGNGRPRPAEGPGA